MFVKLLYVLSVFCVGAFKSLMLYLCVQIGEKEEGKNYCWKASWITRLLIRVPPSHLTVAPYKSRRHKWDACVCSHFGFNSCVSYELQTTCLNYQRSFLKTERGGGGVACRISHNSSCRACCLWQGQVWELMTCSTQAAWQTNATEGEQQRWRQSLESHCSAISRFLWKQTHLWQSQSELHFFAAQAHIAYILRVNPANEQKLFTEHKMFLLSSPWTC